MTISLQKITPCLWFDDQAEEAVNHYVSIFKNSKIGDVTRYGEAGYGAPGSVKTIMFRLDGQEFMALNGGPHFRFNEAVSFVTSPGYLRGGGEREAAGLSGGPSRVITDKAIFDFEPESKRMRLVSIHPGITQEDVLANMNFQPIVPHDLPTTELPTVEQIRLIREEIDPEGMYAG